MTGKNVWNRHRGNHFLLGVLTAVLSIALIACIRRVDRISWQKLGMSSLRRNLLSFMTGVILWAVPAGLGLVVCLMTGWVKIEALAGFNQILPSLLLFLPSTAGAIALGYMHPKHNWRSTELSPGYKPSGSLFGISI